MCRASGALRHCWCLRGATTTGRFDNNTPVKEDETLSSRWQQQTHGSCNKTKRCVLRSDASVVAASTTIEHRRGHEGAAAGRDARVPHRHAPQTHLIITSSLVFFLLFRLPNELGRRLSIREISQVMTVHDFMKGGLNTGSTTLGTLAGEWYCRRDNNLIMRFKVPKPLFLRNTADVVRGKCIWKEFSDGTLMTRILMISNPV